jgi:hypothetical protein
MGHRAHQQIGAAKIMPDAALKGLEIGAESHSTALKKRSARQVQK